MNDLPWTPARTKASLLYAQKSPRSVCTCNHQADGGKSQHEDTSFLGHGKCTAPNCLCTGFKFKAYTAQFEAYMADVAEPGAPLRSWTVIARPVEGF